MDRAGSAGPHLMSTSDCRPNDLIISIHLPETPIDILGMSAVLPRRGRQLFETGPEGIPIAKNIPRASRGSSATQHHNCDVLPPPAYTHGILPSSLGKPWPGKTMRKRANGESRTEVIFKNSKRDH